MKTLHKKAMSVAAVALLSGLACSSVFAEEAAAEAPENHSHGNAHVG